MYRTIDPANYTTGQMFFLTVFHIFMSAKIWLQILSLYNESFQTQFVARINTRTNLNFN